MYLAAALALERCDQSNPPPPHLVEAENTKNTKQYNMCIFKGNHAIEGLTELLVFSGVF